MAEEIRSCPERQNAYGAAVSLPNPEMIMDRIEAMGVFVAALDEGGLAGAGRRLGHSPAAVSRAIAFLESHVGVQLLHRTTRSIRLSEAGDRYPPPAPPVPTGVEVVAP